MKRNTAEIFFSCFSKFCIVNDEPTVMYNLCKGSEEIRINMQDRQQLYY